MSDNLPEQPDTGPAVARVRNPWGEIFDDEDDEATKARWELLLNAAGVPHGLNGWGHMDARTLFGHLLDETVGESGPTSEPRKALLSMPSEAQAKRWLRMAVRSIPTAQARARGAAILASLDASEPTPLTPTDMRVWEHLSAKVPPPKRDAAIHALGMGTTKYKQACDHLAAHGKIERDGRGGILSVERYE